MERAKTEATYAWNASPISTARMKAEIWNVIKNKDWSLVGGTASPLWNIDKFYRTIGGGGAAAVGSALPTSVGAALANKKHGRLSVSIQSCIQARTESFITSRAAAARVVAAVRLVAN